MIPPRWCRTGQKEGTPRGRPFRTVLKLKRLLELFDGARLFDIAGGNLLKAALDQRGKHLVRAKLDEQVDSFRNHAAHLLVEVDRRDQVFDEILVQVGVGGEHMAGQIGIERAARSLI